MRNKLVILLLFAFALLAFAQYTPPSGGGVIGPTGATGATGPTGPAPGAWTDYSGTIATTNLTSVTVNLARWQQVGKTVYLMVNIQGTSNGSTPTLTVPDARESSLQIIIGASITGAAPAIPAIWYFSGSQVLSVLGTFINATAYSFYINTVYEGT